MAEEKLTNQVIRYMFNDIKKDLIDILDHVSKTNGRVKQLEIWRARILGALTIISLIVVPVIIQALAKQVAAYFK